MADEEQEDLDNEVVFELNPNRIGQDDIINFHSVQGIKLYKTATKPFEDKFDMTAVNLKAHLEDHSLRAWEFNWNESLFDIPIEDFEELDEAPATANLCEEFGRINWTRCQLHAVTYVNTETRTAQLNEMLYLLCMNSLTLEAKKQIMLKKDKFTVEGVLVGAMLLMLIIETSNLASNATIRNVRETLTGLDLIMATNGSDILKFNAKVDDLLNTLASHGQTTEDLFIHLCKGYKAASDKKFVKWITDKEDKYDEGETIEPDALMILAANKFKLAKDRNTWCQPDEQDAKIIALSAQIEKLQSNRKKGQSGTSSNSTSGASGASARQIKWQERPKDRVAPTDGKLTKTGPKGKELKWCAKHNYWCGHFEDTCAGVGVDGKATPPKAATAPSSNESKTLKLAAAYAAIQDAAEDSE